MAEKVFGDVFDKRTIRNLNALRRKHFYDNLGGVLSAGKEAAVFLCTKRSEYRAIKVYMIEKLSFDKIWKYVHGDPRFFHVKKSFPQIIYAWCEKEFSNLAKANNAGVPCPKPIKFFGNALVMEFVGDDKGFSSPMAKNKPPEKPGEWYDKLLSTTKKLYKKEGLIHGDLSEYNVLNHDEEPVIIDFSQGVLEEHVLSDKLLRRDITNLNNWFSKLGVETREKEEIFEEIKQTRKK